MVYASAAGAAYLIVTTSALRYNTVAADVALELIDHPGAATFVCFVHAVVPAGCASAATLRCAMACWTAVVVTTFESGFACLEGAAFAGRQRAVAAIAHLRVIRLGAATEIALVH